MNSGQEGLPLLVALACVQKKLSGEGKESDLIYGALPAKLWASRSEPTYISGKQRRFKVTPWSFGYFRRFVVGICL